jgi:hypothetical protein
MKSGLPVYPPKEGWYGWNYEKWKDGRMEGWNVDLPGLQGLCAKKPDRSDDLKYRMLEISRLAD